MKWTSIVALYFIFWWFSLFLVLPFRLKSDAPAEAEAHVPGQAESAPPRFSFARTAKWTTLVAAVLFGAYYLIYVNGWVTIDMLDMTTVFRP